MMLKSTYIVLIYLQMPQHDHVRAIVRAMSRDLTFDREVAFSTAIGRSMPKLSKRKDCAVLPTNIRAEDVKDLGCLWFVVFARKVYFLVCRNRPLFYALFHLR
jgi:hypothetical protein